MAIEAPQFHGIHLDTGIPFVDQGGHRRYLACLPDRRIRSALPSASTILPTIPEKQWVEISNRRYDAVTGCKDQDSLNSCTPNAAAGGCEVVWLKSGLVYVRFGPGYSYSLINAGFDQGATLEDCLAELRSKGLCPASIVDETPIYPSEMPAQAATEALNYVPDLVVSCEGYDQVMSGVQLGGVAFYAICVGQNFVNLNSNGIAPTYPRSEPNHAQFADGAKSINGLMYLDDKNSWGPEFGMNGRCYLGRSGFGNYPCGAYLIFNMRQDPREPRIPAIQVAQHFASKARTAVTVAPGVALA